MKTFKNLLLIGLGALLAACDAGMSSSSSSGAVGANGVPETQDFSTQLQAVPVSGLSCFNLINPSSSLDKWYSRGEISIINSCSTNQKINNLAIVISSNNYSLDAKSFAFNSINGMYFPGTGGVYYAKPSMVFTTTNQNGLNLVVGTINISNNVSAYIKPGNTIVLSFGYNAKGKLPGEFSYTINNNASAVGSIQLSVDTSPLKTVCTGTTSCKIPLLLTAQNNSFSSTVLTLTNSNLTGIVTTNLTNLNPGTYTLVVANNSLPTGITFSAAPISLDPGANVTASAVFKLTPTSGNISYTLIKPNITLMNNALALDLVNVSNGEVVSELLSNYDKSSNFSNIQVGSYNLVSYGLADSQAGIYYAPLKQAVTVAAGKTTSLGNINMTKATNLVPLSITLSGLTNGESLSLTLTDSLNYQFIPLALTNGTTQLQLVNGDNVVLNVAGSSKYAAINPIRVVAGQDQATAIAMMPASKLLAVDFNSNQIGAYSKVDFIRNWGMSPNSSSGQSSRLKIVNDPLNPNNLVMQLTYPAGQIGGDAGMTFTPTIGGRSTHLFFQYRVMFPSGFTWVKGGKLPGLTSGPDSPTGCISNTTFDGFSARLMWRENGRLYSYIYNPDKVERCGDYYSLGTTTTLNLGQWYTLTQEVQLNDPGLNNGYVKQWVDKVQVLDLENINLRKSSSIYIDQIKMDSFFGGSSADWAPLSDQHAYFDDFIVSTSMPPI